MINDYRAENGLEPLVLSATLSAAADAHSVDMATNDFMGHDGSNGSSPAERFVENGYTDFSRWAENVFAGEKDAADAFAWWKSSPGHNANMLDPQLAAIGIGRASNPDTETGWFWTTTFGAEIDANQGTTDADACVDPVTDRQLRVSGSDNETSDTDVAGTSPSQTGTPGAADDETDSDIPDSSDDGSDNGTDDGTDDGSVDDIDDGMDGDTDDSDMDNGDTGGETDDGMDDVTDDGSDGMTDDMGDDTGAGPLDSDGDGVPDDVEFNSGTDPNDPNSF